MLFGIKYNERFDPNVVREMQTCLMQLAWFFSVSPHRHRFDVHIWHLHVGHCVALGLDLGPRTFALSADDYRSVRDTRRISAHRIARSLCPQEHYLVYRVVERGSWRDHGCSGLQRWGRKRPLDRRCPGALSRGDRSCGVDAPDCATISTCRLMSAVSAAPRHVSRGENFGLTVVRRLPRLYRGVRSVFNNPDNDIWTGRAFKRSLVIVRRGGLNRGQPHL